jgi:hypothetical protein
VGNCPLFGLKLARLARSAQKGLKGAKLRFTFPGREFPELSIRQMYILILWSGSFRQ